MNVNMTFYHVTPHNIITLANAQNCIGPYEAQPLTSDYFNVTG